MIAHLQLLGIIGMVCIVHVASQVPEKPSNCSIMPTWEWNALYDFHTALNGASWVFGASGTTGVKWNFTDGSCPCTQPWQGVTVATTLDVCSVHTLALSSCNLQGRIPESITNLTMLYSLALNTNMLSGTVPAFFYRITTLEHIQLNSNKLIGRLPDSIGWMSWLVDLRITTNVLTGTIPSSFGNLTNLQYLYLATNHLNGTFPRAICNMTQMLDLRLQGNRLDGPLPECIGALNKMTNIQINNLHLSGTLPASIGNWSSMLTLTVNSNHFSGAIPEAFSGMAKLTTMNIGYNQLTALPRSLGRLSLVTSIIGLNNAFYHLPESICNMSVLNHLDLRNNEIHGGIPECIGNLSKLVYVALFNNSMSGTLPESILQLTALGQLYIASNYFSGTIWRDFDRLVATDSVPYMNNYFSGSLPASIRNLSSLVWFDVSYNFLTGPIDVFNSTEQVLLSNFGFENNQFSGSLPIGLFGSKTLSVLDVSVNCFTGKIPSEICNAKMLNILTLDGLSTARGCQVPLLPRSLGFNTYALQPNHVTGGIPSCVFTSMYYLQALHISGNGHTGNLGDDLDFNADMKTLVLSHNALTGPVPTQLQSRPWVNLDLSYNKLTGTLQTDFHTQEVNSSVSLDVNRLSGNIPFAFRSMANTTILDSNIFACKPSRTDLPQNDPNAALYECGSNNFNSIAYMWLALTVVAGLCASLLVGGFVHRCTAFAQFCQALIHGALLQFEERHASTASVHSAGALFTVLRKRSLLMTGLVLAVQLPCYGYLRSAHSSYTHLYAWTVSAAYLSGETAAYTLLVFWSLLVVVVIVAHESTHSGDRSPTHQAARQYSLNERAAVARAEQDQQPPSKCDRTVEYCYLAVAVLVNIVVVCLVNGSYVYITVTYNSGTVLVSQLGIAFFKLLWSKYVLRYLTASGWFLRSSMYWPRVLLLVCNNVLLPTLATALIDTNCFYNCFSQPSVHTSDIVQNGCTSYNCTTDPCTCLYKETFTFINSFDPPFSYSYQCSSAQIIRYVPVFAFVLLLDTFMHPLRSLVIAYWVNFQDPAWEEGRSRNVWVEKYGLKYLLDDITRPTEAATVAALLIGNARDEAPAPAGTEVSGVSGGSTAGSKVTVLRVDDLMLRLVNHFTIMFTWGVVFPPLCVLACVALWVNTYHVQIGIGRRLVLADAFARAPDSASGGDTSPEPVSAPTTEPAKGLSEFPSTAVRAAAADITKSQINRECAQFHGYVQQALLPIVALSLVLYAFIVFDTLGDVKGYDGAYWVVLVLGLVPLCTAFAIIHLYKSVGQSKTRQESGINSVELPASSAVDNPML